MVNRVDIYFMASKNMLLTDSFFSYEIKLFSSEEYNLYRSFEAYVILEAGLFLRTFLVNCSR